MTEDSGSIDRPVRRGWVIVAALAIVLGVLQVIGVVVLLIWGEWFPAVMGVLTLAGLYWFAAGAWLRTPWGRIADRTPPPGPPELSERAANRYVVVGGMCVIACLIALALQAIAGDW